MYDVAVIGTGAAGVSAVLTLQALNKNFIWFGSRSLSMKISSAEKIRNYPGLPFVSGEEMREVFLRQVDEMGITITSKNVTGIYPMGEHYSVLCGRELFEAKTVIFCTGVESVKPLPGELEFVGRGVSYCATCDGFLHKDKTIAVECTSKELEHEINYLASLAAKVYLVPLYPDTEISAPNVEIIRKKPLAVEGGQRAERLVLADRTLEVDGIFMLKQAVAPSVLLNGLETADGHIVVDRSCAANLKGCYAAGDCTGRPYQYAKAVGEGNIAAHSAAAFLQMKCDRFKLINQQKGEYKMKKNDVIHGFRVEYAQELAEIGATLWRMTYEKNGADLIWLERKDDNKTFAITFKTIPSDDTGVFHILEHSVLCGSDKYPTKEPFVELIKSSMATFLNAMTFPDKTMYPISSRNPQDFLNLIDVYMDAVLHPLSITDPHAFHQEGWHYELDSADGELVCNGVVYNEMKGAYASNDTVLESELNRQLFPDTCYGCESGGYPSAIPSLTYESYFANHHKYYHPSNAKIVLDGSLDLNTVLAKLDGFLCEYDRLEIDADIPYQAAVAPDERTAYYEIGAEEDEENKAILAQGWVFGDYSDKEKNLAFAVLSDVLASSNESPLPKALLDKGLAEDVYFRTEDGIQQLYAYLVVRNTDPAKKEEIWSVVTDELQSLADNGLDHQRLRNTLSRIEFTIREKAYDGMPRGLLFAITSLESWLYGGDPAQNLCYDDVFASLRAKIDEGWFEDFLRETLLENAHHAKVCLLPSKTLGEEKIKAEQARLADIKSKLSDGEIENIMQEFAVLRRRQETEDTPEQLAKLPKLSVKDIPAVREKTVQHVNTVDGITVLHQPQETNGITYLNLYFSLEDIPKEELSQISFFTSLLGESATENYSALELQSELQGKFGHFSASVTSSAKRGQTEQATPRLAVKLALLENNKPDATALLDEVLNRSDLSDEAFVYNILRQYSIYFEQSVAMRGNFYASLRAAASNSAKGAIDEEILGISMLRYLKRIEGEFEKNGAAFCQSLNKLSAAIFTKSRLTVSITGEYDEAWLKAVIALLNDAPIGTKAVYEKAPIRREGFMIPAEIGFAAKSYNINALGVQPSGYAKVAAQLLTFDYMWNDIRVKGGAYGTAMRAPASGEVSLTTFRDPSPARSLGSFDKTGQALRDFCEGENDVEKYIISTIAAVEPLLTPKTEGERAVEMYFSGISNDDLQQERDEILGTTPEKLEQFSEVLDEVCANSGVCVVGGKNTLDACGDLLETVEAL